MFVDGGYGETNNPSWEGRVHYERNHSLRSDQELVMINVGTGTLPHGADEAKLRQRPWWARFLPNGLIEAFGLISDLVKMATESEKVGQKMEYLADSHPEQLFFKRFSADTGIHNIQLDDWQAVAGPEGSSLIEVKTEAYLQGQVQDSMEVAAEKLTEVYIKRHHAVKTSSTRTRNSPPGIESSRSGDAHEEISEHVGKKQIAGYLTPVRVGERVPSLASGSEPTHSAAPSPPCTPDPIRRPLTPFLATVDSPEILQGEGGQFGQKHVSSLCLPGTRSSSRTSSRSRRAASCPSRPRPLEDDEI